MSNLHRLVSIDDPLKGKSSGSAPTVDQPEPHYSGNNLDGSADEGRPEMLFLLFAGALSGAIIVFALTGQFTVLLWSVAAVTVGVVLGWVARKILIPTGQS